ncbi:MAG: ATP-binding protein [Desulfovibrio sp.]|nr:ATP-binding protein [Desulfovibrio sp.]
MSDPYAIPKHFNIAGPCVPKYHYMLDAPARLPEARKLAENMNYFVIHAARQSGKTTLLRALTREINAAGKFYALYCSLETVQGIEALEDGIRAVLYAVKRALSRSPEEALRNVPASFSTEGPSIAVGQALTDVCAALKKPLIIFFDEADCLSGQVLISFLRQLRDGYVVRDESPFPWSVSLIGMRDIRDFKAQVRPDRDTLGSASPFNIVTKALTLRNFTPEQIAALYRQHTEAVGQHFEERAVERAFYWSEGQPWLVNALARQAVDEDPAGDHSITVTADHMDAAAEALILRRDTHIDSLLERLKEPRVRRVMEPVLAGLGNDVSLLADDTKFCLDLGLLKNDPESGLCPANPIYRDVIVRTLNYDTQYALPRSLAHRWMNGKNIDMCALLKEFQQFWRENAEMWTARYDYKEAAPHLILQAFLQRVTNGGAQIIREFALGTHRVDVCVRYAGKAYPLELKLASSKARIQGLEQLESYMTACGASEGWLVIFDRGRSKGWDEKISWADEKLPGGGTAHIVGC